MRLRNFENELNFILQNFETFIHTIRDEKEVAVGNYKKLNGRHHSWQAFPTRQQAQDYVDAFANYPSVEEWESEMFPRRFYAVGVGERPGIYSNW
jgi:hypothetical protein